ncbi:MAG: hypothetical protein ABGW85_04500 [Sulfurimonas sp.]|jgi:hypothetical protein
MWLNQLKVAIVEQDTALLELLLNDIPKLEKKEDIESAIVLLGEATRLVQSLKDDTQKSMQQVKKNINFLKSGVADTPAKFDITS